MGIFITSFIKHCQFCILTGNEEDISSQTCQLTIHLTIISHQSCVLVILMQEIFSKEKCN